MFGLSSSSSYAVLALSSLSGPADQLSVGEIVIAVEGPAFLEGCLLGKAECSDRRACPAHAFWGLERERIRSQLQRMSLADVARFERDAGRGLKLPVKAAAKKPASSRQRQR